MKSFVLAAIAASACAFSEIESAFLGYMTEYGKSYSTVAEYEMRLRNFAVKHAFITEHNANPGEHTFKVGHNKMSDWTQEEYEAILTYTSSGEHIADEVELSPILGAVDWRNSGCVNAIKDQGQCGSCWAFSGTASTETSWCHAKGTLYSLSEQQQVDCNKNCYGCNGGWANKAINYLKTSYAESEKAYPYTARDGTCKYNASSATPVKTTGFTNVTADSPSAMKSALNSHVLSVAIQANKMVFQTYTSGIFNASTCGTNLDHATNVVGWGTSGSTEYWIMRNSWGTSWGEKGYMQLEIVSGKGICGIQMEPLYANV